MSRLQQPQLWSGKDVSHLGCCCALPSYLLHVYLCRAGASTATKRHSASQSVAVELTNTSFSSRKLNATVLIGAPLDVVWGSLTDYDNLGTFIPSLVENKCLEKRPQGCLLYQVC